MPNPQTLTDAFVVLLGSEKAVYFCSHKIKTGIAYLLATSIKLFGGLAIIDRIVLRPKALRPYLSTGLPI